MRKLCFLILVLLRLDYAEAQLARYTVEIPPPDPYEPIVSEPSRVVEAGPVNVTFWDGYRMMGTPTSWRRSCSGFGSCQYSGSNIRVSFSRPVKNIRARIESFPYAIMANGVFLDTFRNFPVPASYTNYEFLPATRELYAYISGPITSFGWILDVTNISFELADEVGSGELTLALSAVSPEEHRKVLTHKYRGDDSYPSPWQNADGQLEIVGYVRNAAGEPVSGKTVYFRVRDPADTAMYVVAAQDAREGDNFDTSSTVGVLTRTSVTSDSNGRVSTTLASTKFASGDNYVVEASLDSELATNPAFVCGATCRSTGTITAWKRIYVEMNRMVKNGAYLRESVGVGSRRLKVTDVRPFPSAPFDVLVFHAAPPGSSPEFYREIVRVTDVAGRSAAFWRPQPGELMLDPSGPGVQHRYDGRIAPRTGTTEREYLADGVAYLSGNRSRDFYTVDGRLVDDLFDAAFVEHVWLTDSQLADGDLDPAQKRIAHAGIIPYSALVNEEDIYQMEWMARKWTTNLSRLGNHRYEMRPNHQAVFLASKRWLPGNNINYGDTTVASGFNDMWLWLQSMPSGVEPEAIVHELAHEFRVNHPLGGASSTGGHCDVALHVNQAMMALHPDKKCTMTSYMYTESAASDGIVGMHYVKQPDGSVHSEYLHLRRTAEPVPQNAIQRTEPQ